MGFNLDVIINTIYNLAVIVVPVAPSIMHESIRAQLQNHFLFVFVGQRHHLLLLLSLIFFFAAFCVFCTPRFFVFLFSLGHNLVGTVLITIHCVSTVNFLISVRKPSFTVRGMVESITHYTILVSQFHWKCWWVQTFIYLTEVEFVSMFIHFALVALLVQFIILVKVRIKILIQIGLVNFSKSLIYFSLFTNRSDDVIFVINIWLVNMFGIRINLIP